MAACHTLLDAYDGDASCLRRASTERTQLAGASTPAHAPGGGSGGSGGGAAAAAAATAMPTEPG